MWNQLHVFTSKFKQIEITNLLDVLDVPKNWAPVSLLCVVDRCALVVNAKHTA